IQLGRAGQVCAINPSRAPDYGARDRRPYEQAGTRQDRHKRKESKDSPRQRYAKKPAQITVLLVDVSSNSVDALEGESGKLGQHGQIEQSSRGPRRLALLGNSRLARAI